MLTLLNQADTQGSQQKNRERNKTAPISTVFTHQRLRLGSLLAFVPGNFGQVQGNSTFTSRRDRRGNQLITRALHSADLAGMNLAVVSATRSGSGPDIDSAFRSPDVQIPFGTEIDDIRPSDVSPNNWIENDDAFFANFDLGLYESQVQENQSSYCPENSRTNTFSAAASDSGEQCHATHDGSDSREEVATSRSESLGVGHNYIFSQQAMSADRKGL